MAGDDLTERLAKLSPAKRILLELRLNKKGTIHPLGQTIPRRMKGRTAPLSFAQQRLWFLHQLEPGSRAYNQLNAVRFQGALDLEALRRALDTIVDRHEVLRTTFIQEDSGLPVQVIGEKRSIDLTLLDLSDYSDSKRKDELQRLMRDLTQRAFDLSHDLMLRSTLLKLGTGEHVLLLVKHHIASDAWSSGILWRELATLYEAFSTGKANLLPDLPIQYADYAIWQREQLQGEVLETLLSYWKQQLDGASAVLELPTDRSRPNVQSFRGSQQSLVLPQALSLSLKELTRRERATLFMTFLAAFNVLLYRYSRQDDIVVGSPIAGRTRPETEGLIGFFINTLVLRTDVSRNPTFRELLSRVREVCLAAYAHQELPFEKLVEELKPERNLSRTPLFQVVFNFNNAPFRGLAFPGLSVNSLRVDSGTAVFDLALIMEDAEEGLIGRIRYSTDLFWASTITQLLTDLEVLLSSVATEPDLTLREIAKKLDKADRQHQISKEKDLEEATIQKLKNIKRQAIELKAKGGDGL